MDTDIEPGLTQPARANGRRALRLLTFVVLAQCLLAPRALAENWQQPRMPWGDPDLQGIWTSATLTNLTRPDEVNTLIMTEQQALAWEKFGQERMQEYENIPEGDLPVGGDTFAGYNTFWMDPGTRVLRVNGTARSSIIVEPEDGQLPLRLWGRVRMYWRGYQALNATDNPEQRNQGERCTVGFGSTGRVTPWSCEQPSSTPITTCVPQPGTSST